MPPQQFSFDDLILDITDKQYQQLDDPSVGLSPPLEDGVYRVCNAAFMQFSITYRLTNGANRARRLSIGLIQNACTHTCTGKYQFTIDTIRIRFDEPVPFLDAETETSPYYNNDARKEHEFKTRGNVDGTLVIRDRPTFAIPDVLGPPEGQKYVSQSMEGQRGLKIWLAVMENNAVIGSIPLYTWTIDLATGKVAVTEGAGQPIVS